MATLRTTNLQHPDSSVPNLVLQADGTVDGPGAGGLVAVRHALKTDAESFTSVAGGGNVAVPGLSITHEVSDPANRLIITAYFGAAADSAGEGSIGLAIKEGTNFIAIGDADGNRSRVTAGMRVTAGNEGRVVSMPSVTFVHTPGAGEKTYVVHIVNVVNGIRTLYVNRSEQDGNDVGRSRTTSALVIQEVKV